jgi:hypothetical protein
MLRAAAALATIDADIAERTETLCFAIPACCGLDVVDV